MDASNKREVELRKLKRELEDTQAQRDSQMAALRKKSQEAINELNEQIDQLQKAKLKYPPQLSLSLSLSVSLVQSAPAIDINCICDVVCHCVRGLRGKRLELSTPKLVQM